MANFITDLKSSNEETVEERRGTVLPRQAAKTRVLRVLQAQKSRLPNGSLARDWIPQPGTEHLNPFVKFGWLQMPAGAEGRGLRLLEGVEMVTFLAKGGYRHEDQHRGTREIVPGSVEYLRGGSGLWHQEHAMEQAGFEAFQVTLELPPMMRKGDPHYESFGPLQTPLESKGDHSLRFLAGGPSPLKTATPLIFLLAQIDRGARVVLPGAEGRQAFVCVVRGRALIGTTLLKEGELGLLSGSEDLEVETGDEELTLLLASGRPVKS